MLILISRHELKIDVKQEIESPPEPPNKKYKWCFESSKPSGSFYCW